jgi:hypothetical protein
VFKLNKDGGGYSVLHGFLLLGGGDGSVPRALVVGSDSMLYGMAGDGGSVGVQYIDALTKDSDGALYAATHSGGDMGLGTLFALRPQSLMQRPVVSGVGVTVRLSSVPGSIHRLQRASALDGSWQTLTDLFVATNGVAEFTDPAPPQPSGFYRTMTP